MRIKVHNLSTSILVVFSAAFYAASFLSNVCWPGVIFSFYLLFLVRFASYNAALWLGLCWGLIAFGLVHSAHLDLIVRMGSLWIGFCALLYWAVLTALWFCMSRVIGWLWSTVIVFIFMVHAAWLPLLGRFMGYGVICPLIPCMNCPPLLQLLPFVGWELMRFSFFLFCWSLAERRAIVLLLAALPFVGGFLISQKKVDNQSSYAFITQSFIEDRPYERAQELTLALIRAQIEHPQSACFIFPESAFPYPLEEHSYCGAMLQGNLFSDTATIVIGAYQKKGEKIFNAVFLVNKSRIILGYVKRLLLPFLEEGQLKNPLFSNLHKEFLQGKDPFSPGPCEQPMIRMNNEPVLFRVCSELLWDVPSSSTIIALVHDGYYRFSYYPRLFKQFAAFQALRTSSILFYSGWVEAGCLGQKR